MAVPSIVATSASTTFSGDFSSAKAFDGLGGTRWAATTTTGWLRCQLASAYALNVYGVQASDASGEGNRSPQAWTFEGSNDGSSWTTLDTRSSETGWGQAEVRFYPFTNSTSYTYYRLNISANNGGSLVVVTELLLAGAGDRAAAATENLDPSYTSGGGVDGNTSTLWAGTGTAADGFYWIAPSAAVYTELSMSPNGAALSQTPSGWTLAGSADGKTWTTLDTRSSVSWPSSSAQTFTFSNSTAYRFFRLSSLVSASSAISFAEVSVGGAPTSTTGAIAASAPAATSSAAGTVTYSGSIAATAPAATSSAAGTATYQGDIAATAPAAVASATGISDATVTGQIAATATAATASAAGLTTVAGALAATAPAAVAAIAGDVPTTDPVGSIAATAPAATASVVGDVDSEPVALALATVEVEAFAVIELTPGADLDVAVPVLSEKNPAPVLSAALPATQRWVDYTPTTDVVGYVHIWVDGQDVTYFRGAPTLVRNWTSEAPWGDKTAVWEMPQLDPFDELGAGDLSFLRPDAPVVIGIVDDVTGAVTRKWSGFYHARTTGFDTGEDYVFEAHGNMWGALFQSHEPPPYQKPIDVGRLVPRMLNKVIGRRWNPIPEVVTGIRTRYRGSSDEKIWQSVQNVLAEAWTDDGRQWTLVQVSDDEYRLRLKAPMSEVHGTFAFGNPGIDVDITLDEDSRVDIVKCRGIAPGGGAWRNVFYPGIELLNGLPYPNSDAGDFINPGEDDADTDSGSGVTDWQTKVKDLGYASGLAVSGVMSSAWVDVVYSVQRALSLAGVDGQIGPETWTATFNEIDEDVDLTPRRLPMAYKPEAWPWKDAANGAILGPNPAYDPGIIPREVALDLGPGVTKAEGRRIAKKYLSVHGEAVVTGRMQFRGCLDDLARTDLTVGTNVEVRGYMGRDVVVQLSRLSVDLDTDGTSGAYVVTADADESARDALTVEQILQRNRDALPDPARRPGNPNRSSRNVKDEGFSWDAESPCGVLTRTAVNGDAGYWSRKTIPFAEVGQLAGIRLHSTVPFAFAVFATLRMTPRKMRQLMPGGPFSSTDPWRPIMDTLEGEYGLLGAWGAQDNACGYGGGMESDGYSFNGEFIESNTLEYVTETPPYVDVFLFARGDSGFVWGDFLPARQT